MSKHKAATSSRTAYWLTSTILADMLGFGSNSTKAVGHAPRSSVRHSHSRLVLHFPSDDAIESHATTAQAQLVCRQQHGLRGIRVTDGSCCLRSLGSYLLLRAASAATVNASAPVFVPRVLAAVLPQVPPSAAAGEPALELLLTSPRARRWPGLFLSPARQTK